MSVKIAQLLHEVWMYKDRHQRLTADVQDMEKQIANLTRELAEARRERDLLAYHVAPHTDEAFRSSHCAEQIIDAGLQAKQDALTNDYVLKSEAWDGCQKSARKARDKALEAAAKVADEEAGTLFYDAGAPARKVAARLRALKEKP